MSQRDPKSGLRSIQYRRRYLQMRSVLHDRVTDLPVLAAVVDRLRTELDQRQQLGVLTVDVANLDVVESLYGWQVFDRLRTHASKAIRQTLEEIAPGKHLLTIDRAAGERWVGFVYQEPDGSEVTSSSLMFHTDKMRQSLARCFEGDAFQGLNPPLEIRCGFSTLSIDPFFRFERRIYSAVELALRSQERRRRRREAASSEALRKIVRDGSVESFYQPVVDLQSREVVGYEALVRGPRDSSLEEPRSMFALSSKLGIEQDLDGVCRTVALRDSEPVIGTRDLFINVQPGSLECDASKLVEFLSQNQDIELNRVVVEVSERGGHLRPERVEAGVTALRKLGVRVAIDDVGTGPQSQRLTRALKPDFLKLDLSLVRDIHKSLMKQEVLTTLIGLAGDVHAEVIAEGVETEAEAETLTRTGARYGQGYLFAVPSPGKPLEDGARQDHPTH